MFVQLEAREAVDTRIVAIGILTSNGYECPKPAEFGDAGAYWNMIGWKARVNFVRIENQIRPREHINLLAPLLPDKYSPLQILPVTEQDSLHDGRGGQ